MEPDLDDTGMQWPPGVAKHKRVRLEMAAKIHDSLRFDDDRSSAVTAFLSRATCCSHESIERVRMHEVLQIHEIHCVLIIISPWAECVTLVSMHSLVKG